LRVIVVYCILDVRVITEVVWLARELVCIANIIASKRGHQFEIRKAVVEEASAVGGESDDEVGKLLKETIAVDTLHDCVDPLID
jgi:hypothetical protein